MLREASSEIIPISPPAPVAPDQGTGEPTLKVEQPLTELVAPAESLLPKFLPPVPSRIQRRGDAGVWLRQELVQLLKTCDKSIQEALAPERRSTKQLFEVLRYVEPSIKLTFLKAVIDRSCHEKKSERTLELKVENLVYFTSLAERIELLKDLVSRHRTHQVGLVICDILRATKDIPELSKIVRAVGLEHFTKIKMGGVREFVAQATLGKALLTLPAPDSISKYASNLSQQSLRTRLAEVEAYLRSGLQLCRSESRALRTRTSREYLGALRETLKDFLEFKRAARGCPEKLKDAVNLTLRRTKLELQYGVSLRSERDEQGKLKRWFDSKDLVEVGYALGRMGPSPILFTPKIYIIRRTEICPNTTQSVAEFCHTTGEISISDDGLTDEDDIKLSRRPSSLAAVLIHEVGHAIIEGHVTTDGYAKKARGSDQILGPHDPYRDFEEYMAISRWRLRSIRSKDIDFERSTVTIRGTKYLLGTRVVFEGAPVCFVYSEEDSKLFYFRTDTELGSSDYSRTSPFEDFAEAYKDYCSNPRRLIAHSPLRFAYCEQWFHLYENRPRLLAEASIAIENSQREERQRKLRRHAGADLLVDCYERLSKLEQIEILLNLKADGVIPESSLQNPAALLESKLSERRLIIQELASNGDSIKDAITEKVEEKLASYNPGLLAALVALRRGEEIAFFAERGNSDAHAELTKELGYFLAMGSETPLLKRNQYYLRDAEKSARLGDISIAEKKVHVISDFARAYYFVGKVRAEFKTKYDQIVIYENNQSMLEYLVDAFERPENEALREKVQIVDFRNPDTRQLAKIFLHMPNSSGSEDKVIHFFNLDGSLISLGSEYKIIGNGTLNDRVEINSITPERYTNEMVRLLRDPQRFDTKPTPTVESQLKDFFLNEVRQGSVANRTTREPLQFSDREFTDSEVIYQQLRDALEGREIFKPTRTVLQLAHKLTPAPKGEASDEKVSGTSHAPTEP